MKIKMKPFMVMEVLEEAKKLEAEGIDIIHLEVGEPDFNVPKSVEKALIKAVENGETKYTHSLGVEDLRKSIAKKYNKDYSLDIDENMIVVTSGSSPALLMAFYAILDRGDVVAITDPGYPCYESFISAAGGEVYRFKVDENNGFAYDIDELKKAIKKYNIKALIVNSPMNPAGTVLTRDYLKKLSELDVWIISDEIYHGLVYDGETCSIAEFRNDKYIIINGFSKLYAMTGVRLGYAIVPKTLIRDIQILQQNLFISASSLAQRGGVAALENSEKFVLDVKTKYNKRRIYLLDRLKKMGFDIKFEPKGAFYVMINVSDYTKNSYEFVFDVLRKAHVGVTPGIDFGANGEGYIRLSYANSMENIKEACDRLETYFKSI